MRELTLNEMDLVGGGLTSVFEDSYDGGLIGSMPNPYWDSDGANGYNAGSCGSIGGEGGSPCGSSSGGSTGLTSAQKETLTNGITVGGAVVGVVGFLAAIALSPVAGGIAAAATVTAAAGVGLATLAAAVVTAPTAN